MKTVLVIALLSSLAWACPKGDSEWEGSCVVDIQPEVIQQTYKPSTEKPSRNPQPAYERSDVKIIDIKPEMIVDDEINAAKAEDARLGGKKP